MKRRKINETLLKWNMIGNSFKWKEHIKFQLEKEQGEKFLPISVFFFLLLLLNIQPALTNEPFRTKKLNNYEVECC